MINIVRQLVVISIEVTTIYYYFFLQLQPVCAFFTISHILYTLKIGYKYINVLLKFFTR